ncbi:Gfo/Idh/MocA family oxidoreductase [Caldibacillus lycopersici]|uniref:Gfo/Idh/MocA family oxidoreductase n=1 Tax=Perspicuibacillus lycopersici TaxID=1325689 RepID=A0AAE3IXP9_9BACI|nr:Gfo/Idh/MocA family oxidoreductase [Perspicuibacillus lycopersici]MCU9614849.1 Gfo/Idh/MocA family oxidoreductase [Perspicuibacillus lycopersici]
MAIKTVGIIMNGVTGRMGTNQHLIRSIVAIREQGGVVCKNGDVIMPDPILVGRNEEKLKRLAETHHISRWSTNLEACLLDEYNIIYFDAQTTARRAEAVRQAIKAGKHIYCEKPTATSVEESLELARLAYEAGVKNGVVQDKLFLPGLLKLKRLIDSGFFGKILSVRMEFGYWVFEGDWQQAQRPSWNYRKEDGGGIIVDMFAHWRYVLDNLFGNVRSLSCLGATHIEKRYDEEGNPYVASADDAAYATFELEGGIIVQANSSWTVRVNREDLLTIQVDGTEGSAVCGLRDCKIQHRVNTPKPVWNPDIPNPFNFFEQWQEMPTNDVYDNGFKVQWELFLKHVVLDEEFRWDLLEGAKGTQLSDLALQSWKERRWVDVPELTIGGTKHAETVNGTKSEWLD